MAGGTDLLLDLRQGRLPPLGTVVDLTAIEELQSLRVEGPTLFVGAAVCLRRIAEDTTIRRRAACLAEACQLIGGPQVRNVATLGGNVGHALPAGDGTIALVALGAEAQIVSIGGVRWLPVEELIVAPGRSVLDPERELLTTFRVALSGMGEGSAFDRVMRPQGVAIAILNMGASLAIGNAGEITNVRLAMGPAGPRPTRCTRTESFLCGMEPTEEALDQACEFLLRETTLRTSPHRATQGYRRHMARALLGHVVPRAYQAAIRASQARDESHGV
jgi:carbon-monoxide dehydrogenase medium subunit